MMLLRRGPSPPLHCSSFTHRRHIHPAALIMTAKALKVTKVASTWGWMAASRTPERAARFRLLTQRVAGALTLSLGGGGAYIAYQHSERVPVSGRTRLLLTSREEEIYMADCVSEQVTSDVPRKKILLTMDLDGEPPPPLEGRLFGLNYRGVTFFSRNRRDVMKHTVLTAAQRIVRAVRQSTDLPAGCDKLHWRLTVIDDPDTVNAFVLPNGHMFVYTGVLRDAPSQDCLAFLLGHECAHAALRHGGEKLSKQPALEMMGLLLTTLIAAVLPIGARRTASHLSPSTTTLDPRTPAPNHLTLILTLPLTLTLILTLTLTLTLTRTAASPSSRRPASSSASRWPRCPASSPCPALTLILTLTLTLALTLTLSLTLTLTSTPTPTPTLTLTLTRCPPSSRRGEAAWSTAASREGTGRLELG